MLFDTPRNTVAPLAARMRPTTRAEVVSQDHLLGEGAPLRRLIDGVPGSMSSVILYGPPGSGKTTLAQLIAQSGAREFVEISAVSAGVKEVREALERARFDLGSSGRETVLFIDEVHRFSKAQQDALLPAVENRLVTLVAATTENPSFSIISPLLSRSLLITLRAHSDQEIGILIDRALASSQGLDKKYKLADEARTALITFAQGDARRALTYLEAGVALLAEGEHLTTVILSRAVDRVIASLDGDSHYDMASAFIKSIRGSDVDAAMHYLARMLESGEDPRFIARRLMISASEDVGLADPGALGVTVAAANAVALIGMPEARIILAEATAYLAVAPKSNASYLAIDAAIADVRAGTSGPIPSHLRDANSGALRDDIARESRQSAPYRYPHDYPEGVVAGSYLPDALQGRAYYEPTERGFEARVRQSLIKIKSILMGEGQG